MVQFGLAALTEAVVAIVLSGLGATSSTLLRQQASDYGLSG